RTIYEPSPVSFRLRERQHLVHVHKPSSIIGPVDRLLWWNFIDNEVEAFFSRWYPRELNHLNTQNIQLTGPRDKNQRMLWQRKRPLQHVSQQLILVIPQMLEGQEVLPHPLFGDLEACFSDVEILCYNLDHEADRAALHQYFESPGSVALDYYQLGQPKPMLHIQAVEQLAANEEETFTSLDALFYYPYQWAFRYKSKLRKSSILSVVNDVTLMGNLAHRFFELLLGEEQLLRFEKQQVEQWIDDHTYGLLSREGAVLLMYGREPERLAFINKVKYAAWSLVSSIRNNGWQIVGSELPLAGKFMDMPIKAKADLVLQRGREQAVIDLKWRGAKRRENVIKNEEDLQLVMYSKLLTEDHSWAHTAYFIIEQGKLIARNNLAF
ncbi:MAG: PD-(D/E)XK nuclease family protein, partial [Bacteroidota bacterium]